MEQELDLRPYLTALAQKWWLLIGAGLLFGLVTFLYASSQSDTYQAAALVAIVEPTQDLQFDPRFENVPTRNTLLKAYPELARSDEILQQLVERMGHTGIQSLNEMRMHLTAEAGNEPSLIYFRALDADPTIAAELANEWARLFVTSANRIYGTANQEQLDFYTGQLTDANNRLQLIEQNIIEFQTANRLMSVTGQLDALNQLQTGYLTVRNSLTLLQDDIDALVEQAADSNDAQFAEQITALALQSRAYSIQGSLPVVLQLDSVDIATQNPEQQAAFLAALATTVEDRLAQVDARLLELEPRTLELQREKQDLLTQETRLVRDRDLLAETYTALSRKVDEEIIASQDVSSGFRLASHASIPAYPVNTNPLLLTLLGAAFGVLLAALAVILTTWWRA